MTETQRPAESMVVNPVAFWLFDVDGCLVDSLTGTSLRPGTRDLLERLRSNGYGVLLWSAGGRDHARDRATATGIDHLVDAFHDKDGRDSDGRYRTTHFLVETAQLVFVDDRPEDMPVGADVIAVSPYLSHNPHDRGLDRALDRVSAPSARVHGGVGAPGDGRARDRR